MMHHDNVVVCITDNKEKTYREYDFSSEGGLFTKKSSTVILPFDSEYKIFVKNKNKDRRIIVDIDIDGTTVTGNGIVVEANSSGHIERFIDVPKKFKFVPADSDGVGDPTSEDNGNITITIHKERVLSPNPMLFYQTPHVDTYDYSITRGHTGENPTKGKSVTYSCDQIQLCGFDSQSAGGSSMDWMSSDSGNGRGITISNNAGGEAGDMLDALRSAREKKLSAESLGEVGATVEGNHSNQSFGQTEWAGNHSKHGFKFQFTLRGRRETSGMSAKDAAEFEEYKRLQKKFAGK